MLAALASGFAAVDVLLAPNSERDVLERELALADALGGAGRLRLIDVADPEMLTSAVTADGCSHASATSSAGRSRSISSSIA